MADENLDVVKAYLERFNRGSFDVPFEAVDPSVTVDWSASNAPFSGVYCGHDGWVELFSEIRNAFEGADVEVHEYVVSEPHVVVRATVHMFGRDHIAVGASNSLVWTFRDGKVVRIVLFQEHADALKSIGSAG